MDASKFTALSTKVEINLKKTSGISWADLEPTEVKTWTTFGVGNGTGSPTGGTVGSKVMYYNADSPLDHMKK